MVAIREQADPEEPAGRARDEAGDLPVVDRVVLHPLQHEGRRAIGGGEHFEIEPPQVGDQVPAQVGRDRGIRVANRTVAAPLVQPLLPRPAFESAPHTHRRRNQQAGENLRRPARRVPERRRAAHRGTEQHHCSEPLADEKIVHGREVLEIAAESELAHRAAGLAVPLKVERTEGNTLGDRTRAKVVGFLATLRRAEAVQVEKGEPRPAGAARLRQPHGEVGGLAVGATHRQPFAYLLQGRLDHRMQSLSGPGRAANRDDRLDSATMAPGPAAPFIERTISRLKFPQAFAFFVALFLFDLIIPDFVPFIDEILLGLGRRALRHVARARGRPAPAPTPAAKSRR